MRRWSVISRLHSIKLLIVDLDGTLTNGDYLYKRFDVKDGYGLKRLKIVKAVITGSKESTFTQRLEELDFDYILTGIENKKDEMLKIIADQGLKTKDVCYVGDDLNDIECMTYKDVLGIAVHDAVKEIRKVSKYILKNNGGHGALRELTDMITGGIYES